MILVGVSADLARSKGYGRVLKLIDSSARAEQVVLLGLEWLNL